jgi:antitoxin component of RelBE/YafQ-DinJ toxin-antitoxin module
MRLDQEVRHKSEDIEDAVLLDAVQAIRRRVRIVNREYNIPVSPRAPQIEDTGERT